MPILLEERDIAAEVEGARSVLIVPCRFCPAASMAIHSGEPYITPLRGLLKTAPFERLIDRMRKDFQKRGVRTEIFRSYMVHQFVLCMWTARRRRKLRKTAEQYDAVVVLGCDVAVQSMRDTIRDRSCRVVGGMSSNGVMGVKPSVSFPCSLRLEFECVSPVVSPRSNDRSDDRATGPGHDLAAIRQLEFRRKL